MTNATNSITTSAKKVLIALGITLAGAATTFAVVDATNDSSTDKQAAAVAAPSEIATADAPEPAATNSPVEDAPADATSEPTAEARPVPTVVIGQDENGDNIVIKLEVAEACATTFHQPLDDDSLSFIRWEFDAPGLAPQTAVRLDGTDGFSQFTMVNDDQRIIVEQGISSYGDYRFPAVEWDEDANNTTSIAADGSHTVDDNEGEASRTCLG